MHPHLQARAAARGGVFSRADAMSVGYRGSEIDRFVADGRWVALRRGIYADSSHLEGADAFATTLLAGAAAIAALHRPAVLSHVTAAVLHDLPLLDTPAATELPHVSATVHRLGNARPRSYPRLTVHRAPLPAADVALQAAVAVTTPARTVADLVRRLDFAGAVVLADGALHAGLAREDLAEAVERVRTWPGGAAAQRVLAFADGRCEAPSESLLRVLLAASGIEQPHPQVEIHDGRGFVGRVDFLFRRAGVVVEVDGKAKYTDPEVLWREKAREDRLRELGYVVIRVTWAQLRGEPGRTADRIRAALARAAA